jgi:class 3 adenylate cyclase
MKETDPMLTNMGKIMGRASEVPIERGKQQELAIGFFDLVGSTARKLRQGHVEGLRAISVHNETCAQIGRLHDGRVVKTLGDGVLMTFSDSLKAVLAAVNIKYGLARFAKLSTKIGLTVGLIESVKIGSRRDVLGSAVDRCARLESIASPGQIIIDRPLYDAVRSYLKDFLRIRISASITRSLPGIGETEVREIFAEPTRSSFLRSTKESFQLNESGRLPLSDKVAFLESTKSEVIEIGVGLSTFASYFHKFDKTLFKEPIRRLIKRGVSFKCLAIDPDAPTSKIYCQDRDEADYLRDVKTAIGQLRRVKEEFRQEGLSGALELYLYSHLPYYHAMCSDIGEDRPSRGGRMVVSNFLFATKRSDCPVIRFSARSNPNLFETYWRSVRALVNASDHRW